MSSEDPFDREVLGALAEMARAEKSGEYDPAVLLVGPWTGFVAVSAIQLAWRHPNMSPEMRSIVEKVARELQSNFSGVLFAALERGWDPACDVPFPR